MDKLFLTILNMSFTGAFVIAVICLVRLPLKKAPKIISYCLWAVAGFRLVFPFSIESIFSLIPFNAQPIPTDIAMQQTPRINSGIPFMNSAVSEILPVAPPQASVNPLRIWTSIGTDVWLFGFCVFTIYGIFSFIVMKRKMKDSIHIKENIYKSENIKSPFVLGIFNPKIYLPTGLTEHETDYILLHEKTHIRRHDHIIKFFAYFVVCVHWFNPLAWIAFLLMGVDMEMSCDERVLKEIGGELKKDYSMSLLSLATERRFISGSPLAFGEGGIKERIKNVLNFKKSSRVVIFGAITLVAILTVGFAVNRNSQTASDGAGGIDELNGIAEMAIVYEAIPNSPFKDITLIPNANYESVSSIIPVYREIFLDNYERGKQIGFAEGEEGMNWRIYEIKNYRQDYLLAVNDIGTEHVMSTYRAEVLKQYVIENTTEKEKFEKLAAVTLFKDGSANLTTPPISSFAFVEPYYYTFKDDELLIHYENSSTFAIFDVMDDDTLAFKSSTVPLFADKGARYINSPDYYPSKTPTTTYKPQKWIDFKNSIDSENGALYWDSIGEIKLDEFPDTTFTCTSEKLTATKKFNNEEIRMELFEGMPIWEVYFADLNGDELPEICANVSFGSGIVDNSILIYDYAHSQLHNLSDRMIFDYYLSIEDDQLTIRQKDFMDTKTLARGTMGLFTSGGFGYNLITFGIDRTIPEDKIPPTVSTSNPPTTTVAPTIIRTPSSTIPSRTDAPNISLEEAITKAIIDNNDNEHIKTHYKTEAHEIIGTDETDETLTVYAVALFESFTFNGEKLHSASGNLTPVAISFKKGANKTYTLTEYLVPEIGSKNNAFFEEKLPNEILVETDTQNLILKTLRNAQKNFGLKDYIAPQIKLLKPLEIAKGSALNWENYFEITDDTDGKISLSDAYIGHGIIDSNQTGNYDLQVIVRDNAGNETRSLYNAIIK